MTYKYKRILLALVSLLLIFSLVSCGEIVNPNPTPTPKPDDPDDPIVDPTPDDPEGYTFTVDFTYAGAPYIPDEEIVVEWKNEQTTHRATVDETGKATITGLDGEYHVSLLRPFAEYTYDPSYCDVDNKNRDLTIELFKLSKPSKNGTGQNFFERVIEINKTGYYRVEVTKEGQKVHFRYAATSAGEYLFTSMMDVGANNVNPILYYHGNASIAYVNPNPEIITGGGDGFTSNFQFKAYIDNDNITSGGGMVVAFAIAADIKAGEYPAYVDFHLEYLKDYEAGSLESDIVVPKELDKVTSYAPGHEYGPEYRLENAYYLDTTTQQYIFEDDRFAMNPETGFYHLFSLEDYPETDGFGPILYAHISSPTVFTEVAFTHIEDAGNKALSVYVDGKLQNHKLFIQGISDLLVDPTNGGTNAQATVGPYFCAPLCPCRVKGEHNGGCAGACPDSCKNCLPTCRRCPEEGLHCPGYAGVANSDGLCPVTEELKLFLHYFAVSQSYFIDGGGWVETQATPPYHAGEDDQWLFACCYYVKTP